MGVSLFGAADPDDFGAFDRSESPHPSHTHTPAYHPDDFGAFDRSESPTACHVPNRLSRSRSRMSRPNPPVKSRPCLSHPYPACQVPTRLSRPYLPVTSQPVCHVLSHLSRTYPTCHVPTPPVTSLPACHVPNRLSRPYPSVTSLPACHVSTRLSRPARLSRVLSCPLAPSVQGLVSTRVRVIDTCPSQRSAGRPLRRSPPGARLWREPPRPAGAARPSAVGAFRTSGATRLSLAWLPAMPWSTHSPRRALRYRVSGRTRYGRYFRRSSRPAHSAAGSAACADTAGRPLTQAVAPPLGLAGRSASPHVVSALCGTSPWHGAPAPGLDALSAGWLSSKAARAPASGLTSTPSPARHGRRAARARRPPGPCCRGRSPCLGPQRPQPLSRAAGARLH